MKLKYSISFIAILLLSFSGFAQKEKYMYDLNSEFHVGAGLKWGGMLLDVENFNSEFASYGLPEFDDLSFGGGVEIYLGNRTNMTFYTLGASIYSQGQQNDSVSTRLRTTVLEFYSDYNVLSSDQFLLHPSVGLNVSMARINIHKENQAPENIQGVMTNYSSTQSIVSDNIGVGIDVGVGGEFFFGSKLHQSVGLKVGYRFSITKNRYSSAGVRISDAPGMQLGGFYFTNYFSLW